MTFDPATLITRLRNHTNGPNMHPELHDDIEVAIVWLEQMHSRIEEAETALNVWDSAHDSEYWGRHPQGPSDLISGAIGDDHDL